MLSIHLPFNHEKKWHHSPNARDQAALAHDENKVLQEHKTHGSNGSPSKLQALHSALIPGNKV